MKIRLSVKREHLPIKWKVLSTIEVYLILALPLRDCYFSEAAPSKSGMTPICYTKTTLLTL